MMQPPPGTTVNTGRVSKSLLRAKSSQKVAVSSYNKALKKLLYLSIYPEDDVTKRESEVLWV